jgi:chorismate mutase / prephenate dehydratase
MPNDNHDLDLKRLRTAIDAIDRDMVKLLNERAMHAQAIGKLKGESAAYRPEREAQVLRGVCDENSGPLSDAAVTGVFRQIMSACLALERQTRVAYLGPAGSYSHAALGKHFGEFVEARSYATIDDVFRAVEVGQCDYAVVPVENSTEGAVGRTLDLMCQTPLTIMSETRLRIEHYLLAKDTALDGVTKVYSHAQSLAQCQRWLAQNLPHSLRVPVASNSEAARLAAAEPGSAAIAGRAAAPIYSLDILVANIEDEPNNTTRFWVLGTHEVGASGRDRTSLVMSAQNRPGAMYALLAPLAEHGVSMSRLESRPARTGMWEYLFFVDLVGHRNDAEVAAALSGLRERASFVRLLGSYPAALD